VSASLWLTTDFKLDAPTSLVPGTCKWLFGASEFLSCIQGIEPSLLLITGPPGSGKSSVVLSAFEELNKSLSQPVLYNVFNSAFGPAINTACGLLINILVQLYHSSCGTYQEAILKISKQQRTHHLTAWQCPYPILLRLVEQVLDECHSYVLIVDGVDQCEEGQQLVIEFLAKLALKDGVTVIATCRNPILFNSSNHKILEMQSYAESVRADLVRVVERKIDARLELQAEKHEELRSQVAKAVVDHSQNNFLHAELCIERLRNESTPGQIKEAIANIRPEYAVDHYQKLLKTSDAKFAHSSGKLERRQCIFRLLMAAREPLTTNQIDELLAMNATTMTLDKDDVSFNIEKEIDDLCGSFVFISTTNRVIFAHPTIKDFFATTKSVTMEEANLYLANKCLSTLSQLIYRDPQRAAKLLRKHLKPIEVDDISLKESILDSPIYEYAAKYFHEHVTAVTTPPQDLVAKLSRFLQGTEFVTWSETILDLKPGTGYAGQITVYSSLLRWASTLPPAQQQGIQLENYFQTAHILLSLVLKDEAENQLLQYFPRFRLGDFLNGAGQSTSDWHKAYEQKLIVFQGLARLLAKKDPFLLRARAALLQEYFWQKRFSEVLGELYDLYRLQKELVGNSKDGIHVTAWMIGAALVALGKYAEAGTIISNTLEEVRQLRGEKDRFFNTLLLLEGTRLERVNDLQEAAATYRAAMHTMTEIAGPQNVFVLILSTALGSVLRKQGKFEDAEKRLIDGWGGRQRVFSINLNVCLDAALQLAMLYRDNGDEAECN